MKFKLGNIKGPKGDPGPMGPQGPKGDSSNISFPETEHLLKSQNYQLTGGVDEVLRKLVESAGELFKKNLVKLTYIRDDANKKLYLTGNKGFTVSIVEGNKLKEVSLPQSKGVEVESLGVKDFNLNYKNLLGTIVQAEIVPAKNQQKVIILERRDKKTTAVIEGDSAFVNDSTGEVTFDNYGFGPHEDKFSGVKKIYLDIQEEESGDRPYGNFNFIDSPAEFDEIYINGDWDGYLLIDFSKEISVYNYKKDKKYVFKPGFYGIEKISQGELVVEPTDPNPPEEYIKAGGSWTRKRQATPPNILNITA